MTSFTGENTTPRPTTSLFHVSKTRVLVKVRGNTPPQRYRPLNRAIRLQRREVSHPRTPLLGHAQNPTSLPWYTGIYPSENTNGLCFLPWHPGIYRFKQYQRGTLYHGTPIYTPSDNTNGVVYLRVLRNLPSRVRSPPPQNAACWPCPEPPASCAPSAEPEGRRHSPPPGYIRQQVIATPTDIIS